MAARNKSDNARLETKLALRRYFLEKYHADGSAQVLDCCQASGSIWRNLRSQVAIKSYWGLDVKRRKGRLAIDSVRVLQQPGWPQDVIDVDTYGYPWNHWLALLENVGNRPATVFLTIGMAMTGQGPLPNVAKEAIGLNLRRFNEDHSFAATIQARLAPLTIAYLLSKAEKFGKLLVEAVEAFPQSPRARYIGVRIEPRKDGGPGLVTPTHQHQQAKKEPANV